LRIRSVPQPPPPPPPPYPETGLDRILKDKQLQNFWFKRLIAYIIDIVIVGIAVSFLALLIAIPYIIDFLHNGFRPESWAPWSAFPALISVISLLYFAFLESSRGQTIGKSILGLKVITGKGEKPTLDKAFLRSLSKLHWVLLLLDILFGLGTRGNPEQKFSDRYTDTFVTTAKIGREL